MADRPATLLERLNHVLEDLAVRMGTPGPGNSPPPQGVAEGSPHFLDPIKRLLERIAQAVEKAMGSRKEAGGGTSAPNDFQQAARGAASPEAKNTPKPAMPLQGGWQDPPGPFPAGGNQIPRIALTHPGSADRAATPQQWPDFNKLSAFGQQLSQTGPVGQSIGRSFGQVGQLGGQLQGAAAGGAAVPPLLIAQAAEQRMSELKAGVQHSAQAGADMMRSDTVGGAVGGVFAQGEAAGEMIGGPVGEAVTQISGMAKAAAESVDRLRQFDREILNATFRFGEFSAQMAQAEAEQEIRDIELSMQKGDAQSASARKLAESMSRLNETLAPFENAWANFRNRILTHLTNLVNNNVKIASSVTTGNITLDAIAGFIKAKLGGADPNDDDSSDIREIVFEAGNKFARPDRFPEG